MSKASPGVVVGSVALVLAVWGALEMAPPPSGLRSPIAMGAGGPGESGVGSPAGGASAPRGGPRGGDRTPPEIVLPPSLDGFRSDAWFLPDNPLLGFVEIAGGPFTMGSDPGRDPLAFDIEGWGEGRVQDEVDLPAFYLGRFEVTVAQYSAFVRVSGHPVVDRRTLQAPPSHPVAYVSWPDALAYAAWLDGKLRATGGPAPAELAALLADGWRVGLPTEAQWEKAARGTDARIYPWGDEPRLDRARFRARSPTAVGSYPCPECAHPVADLSGNVWEWTRSPYQPYPYTEADDRDGLAADALWVMRGGSFGDSEQLVRAANRGGADPGARRAFIGFRVALVRD